MCAESGAVSVKGGCAAEADGMTRPCALMPVRTRAATIHGNSNPSETCIECIRIGLKVVLV